MTGNMILLTIGFAVLGYLSGSIPSAVWITRWVKGVDVRDNGSGHATMTNTIRQAGFLPGFVVLVMDFGKGFLPTWLAVRYAPADWVVVLTAFLVVIGHCWPVFAGFRGGIGMASAQGAMFAAAPLAVPLTLALLITLMLILKHSARAGVISGLAFSPLLWLVGLRGSVMWVALAVGLVITVRYFPDWKRKYKELWLDRDQPAKQG